MAAHTKQILMREEEVAEWLSIPRSTLRYWRAIRKGPAWIKLLGRVRYDAADVSLFIENSSRTPSVRAAGEKHGA
jgi:hypothetical protein